MGYESKLIVGEVFGNKNMHMPDDPCPMWMNPIVELSLSRLAQGKFSKLRQEAKYAGVFIFRCARMREDQVDALEMALSMISDLAPEGSFADKNVTWWRNLRNIADDRTIEHKEWEDRYGEPFKRLPFREAAKALREDEEESAYRRGLLAATTIEHFIEGFDEGRWREYDPQKDGSEPIGKIMLIHEGY